MDDFWTYVQNLLLLALPWCTHSLSTCSSVSWTTCVMYLSMCVCTKECRGETELIQYYYHCFNSVTSTYIWSLLVYINEISPNTNKAGRARCHQTKGNNVITHQSEHIGELFSPASNTDRLCGLISCLVYAWLLFKSFPSPFFSSVLPPTSDVVTQFRK